MIHTFVFESNPSMPCCIHEGLVPSICEIMRSNIPTIIKIYIKAGRGEMGYKSNNKFSIKTSSSSSK